MVRFFKHDFKDSEKHNHLEFMAPAHASQGKIQMDKVKRFFTYQKLHGWSVFCWSKRLSVPSWFFVAHFILVGENNVRGQGGSRQPDLNGSGGGSRNRHRRRCGGGSQSGGRARLPRSTTDKSSKASATNATYWRSCEGKFHGKCLKYISAS